MSEASTPVGAAARRPTSANTVRRRAQALAMTPLVTLLVLLTIVPTVYILVISFTNFASTNAETTFIGVDNYAWFLSNPAYWAQLGRTVVFVVVAVSIQLVLAMITAIAMKSIRRGAWIRAIILLPMAAAPIAVLFNWRQILNTVFGPINYIITSLGLPPPDWLGSTTLALPTLIFVDIWQWMPFVFIILAGGLATIPEEIYEAASVDGASAWTQFWTITLPLVLPYVLVAVLFRTVDALKTFDSVQVLTSGGPGSATTMLNYGIFQEGIQFLNFGKAGAAAVLFLIVCILLTRALLTGLSRKDAA